MAKVTAKTAADVSKHFPLGEDAKKLLNDKQTPGQFLETMLAKQLHEDAVRFLAHALPKQESVWWACVCARQCQAPNAPAGLTAAIQTAEKWVADPNEENRRAAQTAAEAAGIGTPAGCAAMAAFWSGGSLAPPNVPAVPPGEHLTAHGVACAVMLAAVSTEPEKAPEKFRKFLATGVDVASGANRWK
jgi:hypothetical protein